MSEDTPAVGIDQTPASAPTDAPKPMTLSKLRHEIRNHLNAIKLSCALLQRQAREPAARETVIEVDRSADRISELVLQHMSDEAAPKLLLAPPGTGRYDQ